MSALLLLECSAWAQTGRLTEDVHREECGFIDGGLTELDTGKNVDS